MSLQSDYTFRLGKPPRIPIPSELRALGRRNRAAGFAGLWYVFESYTVRDGVLVSEGKIARLSAPAVESSLPGELAKLSVLKLRSEKFTDALVAFAARYGNLGYSALAPFEKRCGGDPVYWVKAHARTVALALEVIVLLREVESARRPEERGRARKNLRSYLEQRGLDPRRPPSFAIAVAIADQVRHKLFFTAALLHDPVSAAHQYLRSLINPNIREVALQLYEAPQGKSQFFFHFRAMIEVVYWHLANALEGGKVRRCAECRLPFIATDRRQRFCPPPGAGRSRCASRFHIRTFRRNAKRRRRQKEARR